MVTITGIKFTFCKLLYPYSLLDYRDLLDYTDLASDVLAFNFNYIVNKCGFMQDTMEQYSSSYILILYAVSLFPTH